MRGTRWLYLLLVCLMLALPATPGRAQGPAATPLGTAFTYQGRLMDGGNPASGSYDFRFILYDNAIGGSQVDGTVTLDDQAVIEGLFTVLLDFGSVFTGSARYLEVAVRPGAGTGDYSVLSPRQPLTAAPYALYATGAPWSGLQSVPAGFADGVDNDTIYSAGTGLALSGTTFAADTAYLQRRVSGACAAGSAIRVANSDGTVACETDDIGWSLTGNVGTTPGTHFLGTTDNQALEMRVNNTRALRLEPHATSPNLIGGHGGNSVTGGAYGATIAGGGGGGYPNRVTEHWGTVGGGQDNQAGDDDGDLGSSRWATVGGGIGNTASGPQATVGGGWDNTASRQVATVGGGESNTAGGYAATVGGGRGNNASGHQATVGGGNGNQATADYATIAGGGRSDPADSATANRVTDEYGTVGGGGNNQAGDADADPADMIYATVGGGFNNDASGGYATVGGGYINTASGEFAATIGGGFNNEASSGAATVGGGYGNTASGAYGTVPGGHFNLASGDYSFAAGNRAKADDSGAFVWADSTNLDFTSRGANTVRMRATGGFALVAAVNPSTGEHTWACDFYNGTSWSCSSDRNMKENLRAVDGQAILGQLGALPLFTWNARGTDPGVKHLGPTAQDFSAAFGLGDNDTMIATIDLDGVALAAIQGLHQVSQEQAARIRVLEGENAAIQQRLDGLEARVAALEAESPGFLQARLLLGAGILLAGLVWHTRRGRGR